MDLRDRIKVGTPVHDADGNELGRIERIEGDEIVVGEHRFPHHAFERADSDRLHLGAHARQYLSGGARGAGLPGGATGAGLPGGATGTSGAGAAGVTGTGGATGTGTAGMAGGMRSDARAGTAGTRRADLGAGTRDEAARVPLVEEQLQVGKRAVELGEVEVQKQVTTERVDVPVELAREEVRVRQEKIAERPVAPGEAAFEEGTIRVPVRGEEAVIEKQAFVTGEVVIDRERTTETQTVSETLRREVAGVEHDRGVPVTHSGGGVPHWSEISGSRRSAWEQRNAGSGRRWEDVEPGHHYAHEMGHDERYRGRSWDEVEPHLRSGYADWSRQRGYSSGSGMGDDWARLHRDVREAWEESRTRTR
jgi:uncharacterized protein (TIGR02271 family)